MSANNRFLPLISAARLTIALGLISALVWNSWQSLIQHKLKIPLSTLGRADPCHVATSDAQLAQLRPYAPKRGKIGYVDRVVNSDEREIYQMRYSQAQYALAPIVVELSGDHQIVLERTADGATLRAK